MLARAKYFHSLQWEQKHCFHIIAPLAAINAAVVCMRNTLFRDSSDSRE